MSEAVLVAEDVAVHYGGIKAVDGVDLQLETGRICGLLGPNGSGKSTLLAALTRLVSLTRGRLLLDGKEYQRERASSLAKRGVARTFQTVRLLPDLTVRENVLLGGDLNGGRQRTADVDRAIEQAGVGDFLSALPRELSYGMARRTEIARALAMRPRLLLLDEPTAGMNQAERREISTLMKDLRGEGIAQLLVEHDVQMLVDTCDELVAMSFGSVIARGAPQEVVANESVREVYLGKREDADA